MSSVDSQGVEPWTRGLQDLAVHQHPALGCACCLCAGSGGVEPPSADPESAVLPVAPAPKDRSRTVCGAGSVRPTPRGSDRPARVTAGSRTQVFAVAGRRTAVVLQPHVCLVPMRVNRRRVDRTGLEPVISRLRAWRACRCSNGPCRARPRPGYGARGERTSGARESNAVSPAPKAGGLPSPSPQPRPVPSSSDGQDGSRCPLWSFQQSAPTRRRVGRGGRTRTHYLRFWRPACIPGAPHP